jgi:hypothetical protein
MTDVFEDALDNDGMLGAARHICGKSLINITYNDSFLPSFKENPQSGYYVIGADRIVSSIRDQSFHWTGAKVDTSNKTIHFFDSFGMPLRNAYYNMSMQNLEKDGYKIYRSKLRFQADDTSTCGMWVSLFLYSEVNHWPFRNAGVKGLEKQDNDILVHNDEAVLQWFKSKHFPSRGPTNDPIKDNIYSVFQEWGHH